MDHVTKDLEAAQVRGIDSGTATDRAASAATAPDRVQTPGVDAVAAGSACLFCANERQLKPSCTKQRWRVCKDHFMITCPKCGHEGFWMEDMKGGSYFACFSLDCNWRSTTPPNAPDEPRLRPKKD